jgi:AraC-like DNA-binding protein
VQAQAQPGWRPQYEQLSAGPFEGWVQHAQLPGRRLVREDNCCAVCQRGDLEQGAYGLALPLSTSGPVIFNGQHVGADDLRAGRGDELDLMTPERFSLIAVVVDAGLLHPLWAQLYGKRLAAWIEEQLVQPACALMLSDADEPLSMLQVCRQVGASRRKLNCCFRDVLGTSPLKCLRPLRLNGVRRELRGGAASVQQAAARWGLWQLGEFAAAYRRQFCKLPSQTAGGRG